MRNYNGLPDLWMDVDHQRLVWLSAPRLTSAEVNSPEAVLIWPAAYLVWQTAPRLTNASCYSRYQGIPTPLSPLAVTGRYQLFPYYAAVDHFVKGRPRRYEHSLRHTSLPREIPTLPLTQQRDWHLFSVSPIACAEPIAYSALDWHCTQRNPSPVDKQQRSFKWLSFTHEVAMNHWYTNLASYTALYVPLKHRFHRSLTFIK